MGNSGNQNHINLTEFTFEFFDTEETQWKRATILAASTEQTQKILEEIAPLQKRTIQRQGTQEDTLAFKHCAQVISEAYLVDIQAFERDMSERREPSRSWQQHSMPVNDRILKLVINKR